MVDGPRLHFEPGVWYGKLLPGGFMGIASERASDLGFGSARTHESELDSLSLRTNRQTRRLKRPQHPLSWLEKIECFGPRRRDF